MKVEKTELEKALEEGLGNVLGSRMYRAEIQSAAQKDDITGIDSQDPKIAYVLDQLDPDFAYKFAGLDLNRISKFQLISRFAKDIVFLREAKANGFDMTYLVNVLPSGQGIDSMTGEELNKNISCEQVQINKDGELFRTCLFVVEYALNYEPPNHPEIDNSNGLLAFVYDLETGRNRVKGKDKELSEKIQKYDHLDNIAYTSSNRLACARQVAQAVADIIGLKGEQK